MSNPWMCPPPKKISESTCQIKCGIGVILKLYFVTRSININNSCVYIYIYRTNRTLLIGAKYHEHIGIGLMSENGWVNNSDYLLSGI